jgi:hypothetical protein
LLATISFLFGVQYSDLRREAPPKLIASPTPDVSMPEPATPTGSLAEDLDAMIPRCAIAPTNGEVLALTARTRQPAHAIEIDNGSSGNAIVKIRDAITNHVVVSFFVAENNFASFNFIRDGNYKVQYEFGGGDLAQDCVSFIRPTGQSQFPGIESMKATVTPTNVIWSHVSYTLYSVPNGTIKPTPINKSDFDAP